MMVAEAVDYQWPDINFFQLTEELPGRKTCTTHLKWRSDVPDKIFKTGHWMEMKNLEYRETNNAANKQGLFFYGKL